MKLDGVKDVGTTPNRWLLVEVEPPKGKTFYKVFATWSGSYLSGESWRLNSGIEKVIIHPEYYDVIGASGSVYSLNEECYGVAGATNYGILQSLKDRAGKAFRILSEDEAIKVLKEFNENE